MKKFLRTVVLFILIFCLSFNFLQAFSENTDKKLRIGYVESEPYAVYSHHLAGIFSGLQELGLIDKGYKVDLEEEDSSKVWRDICDNCKSDKIEFVKDMYFDLKEMDKGEYSNVINRDDVDLIIVMGTVAGKYFVDHETKNKFMIFASADPVKAGILKSKTERYNENSFAHIDSKRYDNQIMVAYKFLNFKKIGVVYQNDAEAYSYSGIEQLKNASKTFGFEIVEKHIDEAKSNDDYKRYYNDLKKAYKELANEGIDALYITTATIENEKLLSILEPDIYANNIYTIAQSTEEQVKYGVLLGTTILDTMEQGYFGATQIKSYLEGTPFNELEQVNDGTPKLVLNYDIAKRIGFEVSLSELLIVDTIYKD